MVKMVKCPVCGLEVSLDEYMGHYDSHGRGGSGGGLGETDKIRLSAKRLLEDMLQAVDRKDFESLLKGGIEATALTGRFYHSEVAWSGFGGAVIYNDLAIALLSAYKGDWSSARRFVNDALKTVD